MDTRSSPIRPDVVSVQTLPRPTATPVRVQFSDVLAGSARALVQGAEAAVRTLPGAPLVAAALRGASSPVGGQSSSAGTGFTVASASVPQAPEGPGGSTAAGSALGASLTGAASGTSDASIESSMAQSQQMNLYYLQVQEQVNTQNRTFTALSNVLEVEHSTAKSAIGNIH